MTRVLTDQVTEGQVTWAPMDPEFDTVSIIHVVYFSTMFMSSLKFKITNVGRLIISFDKHILLQGQPKWYTVTTIDRKVLEQPTFSVSIYFSLDDEDFHKY